MAKVRSGQTMSCMRTGGVGVMLVQLARIAGVRVIGTRLPLQVRHRAWMGAEPARLPLR